MLVIISYSSLSRFLLSLISNVPPISSAKNTKINRIKKPMTNNGPNGITPSACVMIGKESNKDAAKN